MKKKIINNLIVIGCIVALMMTGCTQNNKNDNSTENTVTDVVGTEGTEVTTSDDESALEENINESDKDTDNDTSEVDINSENDIDTDDTDESNEESTDTEEDNDGDAVTEEESASDSETTAEGPQSDSTENSNSNSESDNTEATENNSEADGGSSTSSENNTDSSSEIDSTTTTPAPHTHTYDNGVIAMYASCTTTGVKLFTCSCGATYTETIPVAAHNFNSGYCTVCNAADPSYVETYTYEVVLEYGMIDLVNARRTSLGYGTLTWDTSLDERAIYVARLLADNFAHTNDGTATELITCSGRYMSASDCHTNYVNSSGHDDELHRQATYSKLSSATCYKKDSRGNVVATYNVILLNCDNNGTIPVEPGTVDPNPPGPDDIIW